MGGHSQVNVPAYDPGAYVLGDILVELSVSVVDPYCAAQRDQIGIHCDGTVVPCCLDADGGIPLGNLFQQFYNMVDAMVVGRFIGVKALAAVGSVAHHRSPLTQSARLRFWSAAKVRLSAPVAVR